MKHLQRHDNSTGERNMVKFAFATWLSGMKSVFRTVVLMLPLVAAGWVPQAIANSLEDVSFASLPGEKVQMTLTLSGPASEPLTFSIDNPARIALDLVNTTNNLSARSKSVGIGMIRSMNSAEAKGRTRVVINLAKVVPYDAKVDGNKIIVTLGGAADTASAVLSTTTSAVSTSKPSGAGVSNVDFRRGKNGEGVISITLPSKKTLVDMREEDGRLLIDIQNTPLPVRLERTLDVIDFATPVLTIDSFGHGTGTRIEVALTGDYEHLAYQSNNLYTIEVKPVTEDEEALAARRKQEYTGERLSLNFQDIEVRAVLQLLADFTGLNIVVSDTVTGSLTLRLRNVPWDQALDIILKTKGLDRRQTGNVMLVAPSAEIAAQEKLELEASRQIVELAPLRSEFIQINYAKASDLASLLKSSENRLMSERGNVTIDDRTNTLLVQDSSEKLGEIRRLIKTLDVPIRQVLIESRIVIANNDFSKALGVRFGFARSELPESTLFGENTQYTIGGLQTGNGSLSPSTVTGFEVPGGSGNEGLLVDLPTTNLGIANTASIGLAVGRLGSYFLQLELQAAQAEGRGEVISSPRLVTSDQKEAVIRQGVEIPYQQASSSGATSTAFKSAVLELKVKPQITPDDRVILDLSVSKDAVGSLFGGIPSINTQKVTTQVLVNNGETVVLGGVYERTKNESLERVPFFSDLPYVGWAFRSKFKRDDKTELLVFVTPKIIKESFGIQ
ncbi:MAG: type 4a pilus secretin PilQ [Gammaproteobacteria bacterium]|nr:MAG: type 4a pilus secretin PilQ [Gammaproteobacteria bacterium]